MYAVLMVPKHIVTLTAASQPDGGIGSFLCKFITTGNMAGIGAVSSIITLLTVAFERYYAVVHPFNNKGNITKHKLKVRQRLIHRTEKDGDWYIYP